MNSKNYTIFLIAFFFMLTTWLSAQDIPIKKIDDLLDNVSLYHGTYRNKQAFVSAQKALKLAKQHNDKKRMALSYWGTGTIMYSMGLHKEALENLNQGKLVCPANDKITLAKLESIEAAIFLDAGLKDRALNKFYKIAYDLSDEKKEGSVWLRQAYDFICYIHVNGKNPQADSIKKYRDLTESELKSQPEAEVYSALSNFYCRKANDMSRDNKIDSSLFFFDKAFEIKRKYNDSILFFEYNSLGNLYKDSDSDKALTYYLKGIENAERHDVNLFRIVSVYLDVSKLYAKKGDIHKEKEYLEKFTRLSQDYNKVEKDNSEYILNLVLEESQKEQKQQQIKLLAIIGGSVILIILAMLLLFKRKQKLQKEKLTEQIQENVEKVQELTQKVNESFEEIIQLAKTNDPQFWTRFQEVYPDFLNKMQGLNHDLKLSELNYSAYVYLGFSTKEIAEYTFKSVKTIENYRYNLRKKLFLPPEENLTIWLQKQINDTKI